MSLNWLRSELEFRVQEHPSELKVLETMVHPRAFAAVFDLVFTNFGLVFRLRQLEEAVNWCVIDGGMGSCLRGVGTGLRFGAVLAGGEEGRAGVGVGARSGVRDGAVGLEEEVKARFWEALDEVMRSLPSLEKIVIAGDFNGYIGVLPGGYDNVHGGFAFGDRNDEGAALSDFAGAFGLVVVNSTFLKKEDHLITF
ncbi:uncharacterized protein LOC124896619 [Capsicum annuum]|uniref:uncharacterized protein LOC124896619 n=1 Tax=Capsicum annuum TaxID=4072 RepID=UPI001FB0E314|nr:uncharacterized protein LOC124896619 [Capsicum annuum]